MKYIYNYVYININLQTVDSLPPLSTSDEGIVNNFLSMNFLETREI